MQQSPKARLWSPPLFRCCACSFLKDLTELYPPSSSVQQPAQTSLVHPHPSSWETNWHQVQTPTSLVLRVTDQPLTSAQQAPILRSLQRNTFVRRLAWVPRTSSVLLRHVAIDTFLKNTAALSLPLLTNPVAIGLTPSDCATVLSYLGTKVIFNFEGRQIVGHLAPSNKLARWAVPTRVNDM